MITPKTLAMREQETIRQTVNKLRQRRDEELRDNAINRTVGGAFGSFITSYSTLIVGAGYGVPTATWIGLGLAVTFVGFSGRAVILIRAAST